MDPLRTQRVSETMRVELSEIIRFELADPRVAGVDVTEVHLSSDLTKADIVVVVPKDSQALEGLQSARLYLRRQLMNRMDLYKMPELRFVAAFASATGVPTAKILRRVRRGRPKQNPAE